MYLVDLLAVGLGNQHRGGLIGVRSVDVGRFRDGSKWLKFSLLRICGRKTLGGAGAKSGPGVKRRKVGNLNFASASTGLLSRFLSQVGTTRPAHLQNGGGDCAARRRYSTE